MEAAVLGTQPRRHRIKHLLAVGVLAAGLFSCAPPPAEQPIDSSPYAPLGTSTTCAAMSGICGFPLSDLGGGNAPGAYQMVFIGDGFAPEQMPVFQTKVAALVQQLRDHREGFVSWDPSLFHFWRLDVSSRSPFVDDDDLINTPLGAHLVGPELCGGQPPIHALEGRMELALAGARQGQGLAPNSLIRNATFVLLSRNSVGRANGTKGGNVRMSSLDDANVLRHELGHALFFLGDEYTEFDTCQVISTPGILPMGPPVTVGEVGLLTTANTTTLDDDAKWAGLVTGTKAGGDRFPCHHHPSDSCTMLKAPDSGFCPVCTAAIEEHLAIRSCQPDLFAPRVAFDTVTPLPGGSQALVSAAAFDERGEPELTIGSNEAQSNVIGHFAVVPSRRVAEDGLHATAIDLAGNLGQAAALLRPALAPQILDARVRAGSEGVVVSVNVNQSTGWVSIERSDGGPQLWMPKTAKSTHVLGGVWLSSDPFQLGTVDVEFRVKACTDDRAYCSVDQILHLNDEDTQTLSANLTPPTEVIDVTLPGLVQREELRLFVTRNVLVKVIVSSCHDIVSLSILDRDVEVGRLEPFFANACIPSLDGNNHFDVYLMIALTGDSASLVAQAVLSSGAVVQNASAPWEVRVEEDGCAPASLIGYEPGRYGRFDFIRPLDENLASFNAFRGGISTLSTAFGETLLPHPLLVHPRSLPPIGLAKSGIHTSVVTVCGDELHYTTVTSEVTWDTDPPVLVTQNVKQARDDWEVFVVDDDAVARIEYLDQSDEVIETLEEPPNFLAVPMGVVRVRAFDRAGNHSEVSLEGSSLPEPLSLQGCEETP